MLTQSQLHFEQNQSKRFSKKKKNMAISVKMQHFNYTTYIKFFPKRRNDLHKLLVLSLSL